MTFLLRYWRVLAVAAAVVAVLVTFSRCTAAAEQRGYNRATAEMAAEVARANAATLALEQRQRDQSDAAAAAWETERNDLQSHLDRLRAAQPQPIRLCKPARSAPVPRDAEPARRFDDPADGGEPDLRAGPDISGPALVLAGRCEEDRRKLIAWQAWASEALAKR